MALNLNGRKFYKLFYAVISLIYLNSWLIVPISNFASLYRDNIADVIGFQRLFKVHNPGFIKDLSTVLVLSKLKK